MTKLVKLLDRQQRAEELRFEHQKQLSERQQRTEELLAQILKNNAHTDNDTVFSPDTIWKAIDNFHYEQEEDKSFTAYYRSYKDFFSIDCKNWSDQKKTRLLLSKLETTKHNKFVDFILPRKTSELSFDETVKLLTELFSPKTSLFHKRWKCLNLTKNDEDYFATYAAVVNKHCDEVKLSELTVDNFKCLVFSQGLLVEMQKLDGAF